MCPLQSIPVTYARDRSAYVVDLTLHPIESTAFTRQGSLVQIQPRPPFSLCFWDFLIAPYSSCLCKWQNVTEPWQVFIVKRVPESQLRHVKIVFRSAYSDPSSWHWRDPKHPWWLTTPPHVEQARRHRYGEECETLYSVSGSWTEEVDCLRDGFDSSLTLRGGDDDEPEIPQRQRREDRSRYSSSNPAPLFSGR